MADLLIILDNGNYIQGTVDIESKLEISKVVMKFSLDVDDDIKISCYDTNKKMLQGLVVSNVQKEYEKFIKNIGDINTLCGLTNLILSKLKVSGIKFSPLAVQAEGLNRRGFSLVPSQSYSPEPASSSQDSQKTEPLSQEEEEVTKAKSEAKIEPRTIQNRM